MTIDDIDDVTDIIEVTVLIPRPWLAKLDLAVAEVGGVISATDREKHPELFGQAANEEWRMELIESGTCPQGHAWAVYLDHAGEWEADGGSDRVSPDEDHEGHPAITCRSCWAEIGKVFRIPAITHNGRCQQVPVDIAEFERLKHRGKRVIDVMELPEEFLAALVEPYRSEEQDALDHLME